MIIIKENGLAAYFDVTENGLKVTLKTNQAVVIEIK